MRGNRALRGCGRSVVSGESQVSTRPGEERVVRAMRTWGSLWIMDLALEGSRKELERNMRGKGLGWMMKNIQ